ncbi:hypothetical protein [Streptomyces sp. NPDC001880]
MPARSVQDRDRARTRQKPQAERRWRLAELDSTFAEVYTRTEAPSHSIRQSA